MEKKKNYQKELDDIIADLGGCGRVEGGKKPKLLLHACCGPCSSYVLEYLACYFEITVFYYNPNIFPEEEYYRRLDELKALYKKFPPVIEGKVKLIEEVYNPEDFYDAVGVGQEPELAKEAEKGERCRRCYEFRLRRAFEYATKNDFDYFCTTLSISPFKDAEKINVIGRELEREFVQQMDLDNKKADKSLRWLPSDFKKRGGFKRSLEISEEYGMYRQQYCGCVYSMNK